MHPVTRLVVFGGLAKRLARLTTSLLALTAGTVSPIFDASDITSLLTTTNGDVQVAAHGDAVGLQLDKQYMGTKTAAQFISDQPETRNTGAAALVGSATAAAYDVSTGAGSCVRVNGANQSYVRFAATNAYRYRIDIENTGAVPLQVRFGIYNATTATVVTAGSRVTLLAGATSNFVSITAQADGATAAFTVHSFKEIPGYHRTQATGTKRPLYDTSTGYPGILFDGLDDCLPTPAVDWTASDEVTVIAAAKYLGSAGYFAESGSAWSGVQGGFALYRDSSGTESFASRGNASIFANVGGNATPDMAVYGGTAKISTDVLTVRRNAVQTGSVGTDQGTGNRGNYVLNYGSRNNGATLAINAIEYWSIATPKLNTALTGLAETIAGLKIGALL